MRTIAGVVLVLAAGVVPLVVPGHEHPLSAGAAKLMIATVGRPASGALPEALTHTKAPAQRRPAPASATTLEQAVLQQVNAYRVRHQLLPLRWEERVAQQARQHSQAMLLQATPVGHAGFAQRLAALQRVLPWASAAENVAYSQGERDPATQAVQGWITSPGHRRNLLGTFTLTGIGAARNAHGEVAFTQIFLRPR